MDNRQEHVQIEVFHAQIETAKRKKVASDPFSCDFFLFSLQGASCFFYKYSRYSIFPVINFSESNAQVLLLSPCLFLDLHILLYLRFKVIIRSFCLPGLRGDLRFYRIDAFIENFKCCLQLIVLILRDLDL